MKFLAIDTSSNACSVAVAVGEIIVEKHVIAAREHTKMLIPMIQEVLGETNMTLEDLDAIILGNGPGSFIGIRIGASVAQGLAYGAKKLIVPVSSLAAVALEAMESDDVARVVVLQNAHMHEVYFGLFEKGSDELPMRIGEEKIVAAEYAIECEGKFIAAGAGWQRYPEIKIINQSSMIADSQVLYPRASCILRLGVRSLAEGAAILPELLAPTYLRSKVANKPRN